jgi:hypothetical protein
MHSQRIYVEFTTAYTPQNEVVKPIKADDNSTAGSDLTNMKGGAFYNRLGVLVGRMRQPLGAATNR